MDKDLKNLRIGVIGLGYVGLPLAVEFGKQYPTIGFDIKAERIEELRLGRDSTLEVSEEHLSASSNLQFGSNPSDIADCNMYFVTVPTPVGSDNRPDLSPLINASKMIGEILKTGDVVVYESTVYPGATEEVCLPVLESTSGLKFNSEFYLGYSPERINPGDKERPLTKIPKVTSGSTADVADFVDDVYQSILDVPTHKASSIKVAEASKVIENTQRDANIALVNELAMIFDRVGIDTEEVLEAAGSKWNFLPFRPGLVGGHCIGVDPYYLTFKAENLGYHPEMILACRRINDKMPVYVASRIVKNMLAKSINPATAKILMLGVAFKENCPDIRNSKVVDIVQELVSYGSKVDVFDPWVNAGEAMRSYGLEIVDSPKQHEYDVVVIAVAHRQFKEMGGDGIRSFTKPTSVIYDIKYVLPASETDDRL